MNVRGFDKKCCQDFQNSLNQVSILKIWKNFRQAGNSIEGRIIKLNFKKVLNKQGTKNQKFLDRLFDRFKLEKYMEKYDKQEIDLQDFVIGLALLSRTPFLQKVKIIFDLTDLDEDGCLSLETNLKDLLQVKFLSKSGQVFLFQKGYSLLFQLAHKKATRNYNEILVLLKKNNKELKNDEEGLITSDQFVEALKLSRDLYLQQKFIPLNLALSEIIDNVACEPIIKISDNIKKTFVEFRQQLCGIMQNKNQKDPNIIKYPGKVDIIKNDKIIETLPIVQKIVDKKVVKTGLKGKGNALMGKQLSIQGRQGFQQKNTEQNLETYKFKVKKMIETKEDPRLNVRFDQMYKKS